MSSTFKIHSIESAPEAARSVLETAKKKMGFVPNLLGALSESPETAKAFMDLTAVSQKLSLAADEREIAILTISVRNDCHYCVAQHKIIGKRLKISAEIISSIQKDTPIDDARYEAIRLFVSSAINNRGNVTFEIRDLFFSVGFTQAQALEIMLLIGAYTISNYSNGFMKVPIDDRFKDET